MQDELVLPLCAHQFLLQSLRLEPCGAEFLAIELVVESSTMFCLIQCQVSVLDQLLRAFGIARVEGDADAGAALHFLIVENVFALQILLQSPCQNTGGNRFRQMSLDYHEFVSTEPRSHIGGTYIRLYPLCHLLEEEVPDVMPQRVVDQFEPVQVQKVNGYQVSIAPGIGERFPQSILEDSPIDQSGQAVMGCLVIRSFMHA